MGKGLIIASLGSGQYSVQLQFNRDGLQGSIDAIDDQIVALLARIAGMEDGLEKDILELRVKSLQKAKDRYQTVLSSTDPILDLWCTDFSLDLQGEVGTIEVIRNRGKGLVLRPNFDLTAIYDQDRDGQLAPALEVGPYTNFYNLGITPGMQKWKPIYRVGAITGISGDNCDVLLDNILSGQQDLEVNQTPTLETVPIDYMDCNGDVFAVDDRVIVEFTGNLWESPKVIGFESEPRNCQEYFYVCRWHYYGSGDPWTRTYEKATAYGKFNLLTGLFEWVDVGSLGDYVLTNGWDIIDSVKVTPIEDDTVTTRLYGNGCELPYLEYSYPGNQWIFDFVVTSKPRGIAHRLPNGKSFSFQMWETVFMLVTEAGSNFRYRFKKLWKYTILPKVAVLGDVTRYTIYSRDNNCYYDGDGIIRNLYGDPVDPGDLDCGVCGWQWTSRITADMPYGYYISGSSAVDELYGQGDDDFDAWADSIPQFPDYFPKPPCQPVSRELKAEVTFEQAPYDSFTCLNEFLPNRFTFFGLDYPDEVWERFQSWIDNDVLQETVLQASVGSPWQRVASSQNYFIRTDRLPATPHGSLYEPPDYDDDERADTENYSSNHPRYHGIKKLSIRVDSGDPNINYFRAQIMDAGYDRVYSATIGGNGSIYNVSYSTGTYSFEEDEIILIDVDGSVFASDDLYPSNADIDDFRSKRLAKAVELGAPSSYGEFQRIFRK